MYPDETAQYAHSKPAAERYSSKADYVRRFTSAIQKLADKRLIQEEDANRYNQAAINQTEFDLGLGTPP